MAGPRWMRWLLVASLGLNLLVAGALVGDALRDGPPRRARPVELALGPVARALAPEDRRAVLGALGRDESLRPPLRGERRAAFAALLAAVRAEPFHEGRAHDALDGQAQRVEAVERAVRAALVARLAAMTPEARAAYADRLEAEIGRKRD